jgi:signal transduction histidine kinase
MDRMIGHPVLRVVTAAWDARPPRWRRDTHLWFASAVCVTGLLFAVAEVAIYLSHPPVPVRGQMATVELWQYVAQGSPMLVVGFLLVARRAAPGLGWFLLAPAFVFMATACVSTWLRFTTTVTPPVRIAVYTEYVLWQVPRVTTTLLPLFFPAGRLVGRWTRGFAVVLAAVVLVNETSTLLALEVWHPGAAEMRNALYVPGWPPIAAQVQAWLQPAAWLAIVVATVSPLARWRTATGLQRRQISIVFPVFVLLLIEEAVRQRWYWSAWIAGAKIALGVLVPAAIGYTVIRNRLYDLDRTARRIVTGVVPVVLLSAVYAGAAAVMSVVLPGRGAPVAAVLAALAALVGLVLRPTSHWVQRRVDRMLYGDRAEPYQLARQLAARIRDGASSAHVPNAVCQIVVSALRLPGAALDATRGERTRRLAAVGDLTRSDLLEAIELRYRGRVVGRLLAMPRTGQAGLDDLDRAALQPLADLAAPAVSAILLEEELESSRARLVSVREEERSRLRRDVHDGMGPSLAAIRLRIDAAVALLPPDTASGSLLTGASDELREIVAEMRRITDNLRPPALERLGLAGALADLAARLSTPALPVHTSLPDDLHAVAPAVELAAYRITAEAVANAIRHSSATRILVSLSTTDDTLVLGIADNGTGIGPRTAREGVGLSSMGQRAADVGGTCEVHSGGTGTTVTAHLPAGRRSGYGRNPAAARRRPG